VLPFISVLPVPTGVPANTARRSTSVGPHNLVPTLICTEMEITIIIAALDHEKNRIREQNQDAVSSEVLKISHTQRDHVGSMSHWC
jgi:hypothetical protein